MMTKEKPSGFEKRFDIAGCFIEHQGDILLLRRQSNKASGDCWGLPAGKLDEGESLMEAVLREIKEETGISVPQDKVSFFDSIYVRTSSASGFLDFEWHMFSTKFDTQPDVKLNPDEHSEYVWVTPNTALQMNLIHDLDESIRMFYSLDSVV